MSDPKAATGDKPKMMTKLSASAGEFVPSVSYRSAPDEYLKGVGRAGTTRTMCSWPDDKTVEIVGGPVAPIVSSSMHPCNKLAPGDHCAWALDNSMLMGPWQAVLWIWLQLVRPRYMFAWPSDRSSSHPPTGGIRRATLRWSGQPLLLRHGFPFTTDSLKCVFCCVRSYGVKHITILTVASSPLLACHLILFLSPHFFLPSSIFMQLHLRGHRLHPSHLRRLL